MDLGLTGARAVISGGTQGIGLAVARELINEGASVSICARRQDGGNCRPRRTVGPSAPPSARSAMSATTPPRCNGCRMPPRPWGGIDIVVHNATASGQPGPGPESWLNNFNVDLMGMVGMSEGALPYLEESGRAALVQIATITGIEHHDVPISPSYGAMKAASIRHMAQLAQQWGPKGIRANSVSPGPIFIEGGVWNMIKDNMAALYERDRDYHPTKRMGTAEEVARVVAFLASPAASWVNGTKRACGRGVHAGREFLIAGAAIRAVALRQTASNIA